MSSIKQTVTQSGADTFTAVELSLPALDGKSGYQINGIRAIWEDGYGVAHADWWLDAYVQVENTVQAYDADELIDFVAWAMQNTAGVAVATPLEPVKEHFMAEPRLTVQPAIYVAVASGGTSQANDVTIEVFYEKVKLSEVDYLRLLAGGA